MSINKHIGVNYIFRWIARMAFNIYARGCLSLKKSVGFIKRKIANFNALAAKLHGRIYVTLKKYEVAREISLSKLEIAKAMDFSQLVIGKSLDLERARLALGLSVEQLAFVKDLDFVQLNALKNLRGKVCLGEVVEPKSFLSLNYQSLCCSNLSTKKVLLLADTNHQANVVQDYIEAFEKFSSHEITTWNPIQSKEDAAPCVDSFDVIIIHYSICVLYEYFLPGYLKEKISQFRGLKVQIIQDEYRWINRMVNRIEMLGIDILVSSLSTENICKVYHHPGLVKVKKYHSLPGYIPERLLEISSPLTENRKYHITYRGRNLPYFLGSASQEKSKITSQFKIIADKYQLNASLESKEDERLYGNNWIKFVQDSKSVLAVEGGASIFDFDEIVAFEVEKAVSVNPNIDFEFISAAILQKYEGNIIHRTITPRIFEAISLRTALVLYPGSYSGVLIPWQHYIPFERDGSNAEHVASMLKNDNFLSELTERAFNEIGLNPKYHFKHFIEKFDAVIAQ